MKNAKQAVLDLDPMLIQSWYDGELDEDELEDISVNDIASHPMVEALDELGSLVREDVRSAFENFDEAALWAAISHDINAKQTNSEPQTACDNVSLSRPSRVEREAYVQPSRMSATAEGKVSATRSRITRWLPTFIGAALFLFSLPGLITMIQRSDNAQVSTTSQQPQTVVVVDAKSVDSATQNALNYAAQKAWQPSSQEQAPLIPRARIANSDDQLTVEEMDKALKLVLQRLESLEQQNQQRIERGEMPLQPTL